MEHPLVSIITPVYNSEKFLPQTVLSVLNQTYSHWEMLLVDDCSTDNSYSIALTLSQEEDRIRVFSTEKNSGPAVTRNIGIEQAKGSFITFLDADDLWKPEKLEKQLQLMQNTECLVSYSSYYLTDAEGNLLPKMVHALPKLTFAKLRKANYIGNLTGMYHAEKLGKIYSPLLRKRQDWGLWLNALKKTPTALGIAEPLALYRIHNHSVSRNKMGLLKYNYLIYKKVLGYSILKSTYFVMVFLIEHFFVKKQQEKPLHETFKLL